MSACHTVRNWITRKIRIPVERFFNKAVKECKEVRRWVEREVRRKITRDRTKREKRCKKKKCLPWCLCCNKWVCTVVTVVERVVEWVVEVVGEWVVETVCKIVVKVVKIVVDVIIAVMRFLVVFVVCIFTNPRGALDALIDFIYDLVDVVKEIGNLVSDILIAVSDLLDITKEFLLDIGDMFGHVGRFIFGLLAGILDAVRQMVDGARRIIDGLVDMLTSFLHLDFCRFAEGFVNGVAFGALQHLFGYTGAAAVGARGFRDAHVRHQLREIIEEDLEKNFPDDRAEELEDALQMGSSSYGIHWPVHPLRGTVSSRSPHINLREEHQNGDLNLFEIAGYAPFGCSETPVQRSDYRLVYKDTDYRVSLGDLRAYLNQGRDTVPEFELIAIRKRVFEDMLRVADRKLRQIAIHLEFEPLDRYEMNDEEWILEDLNNDDTAELEPLDANVNNQPGIHDICDLPAVIVFGYGPGHFGLASLTDAQWEGPGTIATVRSSFMAHLFGTVLAHEMGHTFALKHEDHHGMEHIMFTLADIGQHGPEDDLDPVRANTFIEYILLGGEPHFTLEDARNAWRIWILGKAKDCLP